MRGPSAQPPWRWPSFAAVTAPAGLDDARARALWSEALVANDALTPAALAERLGCNLRTLWRARAWIASHDAALWAQLRPRETGIGAKPRAIVTREKT